jgi:hypothetical protein
MKKIKSKKIVRPKLIIGIDPGAEGGAVFLSSSCVIQTLSFIDLTDKELWRLFNNPIRNAVTSYEVHVYLEEIVPNMFGFSKSAVAKLYGSFCTLKMLLISLDYLHRIEIVSPKIWQPKIGMHRKPKEASNKWKKRLLDKAQQLFPNLDDWNKTQQHQKSICDALLIAEYGRRNTK